MSNQVSLMYWNDKAQSAEARVLHMIFKITAAKTVADQLGSPTLSTFDAFASQSVIDTYLGTTNEFLLAAFDATSMGTDAFGGVIDMGGQVKEVVKMDIVSYTAGAVSAEKYVLSSSALTSTSLTSEVAKGSSGNVGFKAVLTGVDALTSGHVEVKIYWKSK